MFNQSKAIVLHSIKYGETSLIVNKVPASEFEEIEEQFQMFAEEVIPFI